MRFSLSQRTRRAAAMFIAMACALFIVTGGGLRPALAASGPFADFHGHWSGSGTIREQGKRPERVRCNANYRVLDSSAHEIELQLACDSDTYKFDLSGQFQADGSNHITGNWTESTRGIGGSANGMARGSHLQVHVESGGFSAAVTMNTHSREQSVSIDSHGGGEIVKASITLHRH
jgi:hypothetical protein